jgi:hypothetical protein
MADSTRVPNSSHYTSYTKRCAEIWVRDWHDFGLYTTGKEWSKNSMKDLQRHCYDLSHSSVTRQT